MEQETGTPQTDSPRAAEPQRRARRGGARVIGAGMGLVLLIAGGAFFASRSGGAPAAGDAANGGGAGVAAPASNSASGDGAAPAGDGAAAGPALAADAPVTGTAGPAAGAAAPAIPPALNGADSPAAGSGGGTAASGAAVVEVVNLDPPVTVQVLSAKRVAADTLRVELALVSRSTAPGALDLRGLAVPSGAAGDARPAVAVGTHPLSLTDLCVLTASGSRRLFALRDDQGKPVGAGDFAPLAPGERRTIWAMFPAPPAADTHATLLVGGIALRNVPIS